MNNWERASCSEDFKVSSKAKLGKAFPWLYGEQSPPLVRCNPLAARQRKQGTTKDTGEFIFWHRYSFPWKHGIESDQKSKYPKAGQLLCVGWFLWGGKGAQTHDQGLKRRQSRVVLVIHVGSVGHFLLAWPLRLLFLMPLFLHNTLAGGVQRAGLPLLFPALTLH